MPELRANQKFTDRYTLLERIGYGGFSEVWKVQRDSGFIQAIKVFTHLDRDAAEQAREEFEGVFNLNHNRLLKASDFGIFDGSPYLVLPYCKNGSALSKMGYLEEANMAKVLLDIASALNYLHNQNPSIVHQDIKPDNFMIDDEGNYLLADFGISKKLRKTLTRRSSSNRETIRMNSSSLSGSAPPAYRPPETFASRMEDRELRESSDIWALGVSLFELATSDLPFGEFGGLVQNQGAEIPHLPEDKFSPKSSELLSWCMAKEPAQRPSAAQLEEIAQVYLATGKWNFKVPIASKDAASTIKIKTGIPTVKLGASTSSNQKTLLFAGGGVLALALALFFAFYIGNKEIEPEPEPDDPIVIKDDTIPSPPNDEDDKSDNSTEKEEPLEKEEEEKNLASLDGGSSKNKSNTTEYRPVKKTDKSREKTFDEGREIIDKYNETAESIINSLSRDNNSSSNSTRNSSPRINLPANFPTPIELESAKYTQVLTLPISPKTGITTDGSSSYYGKTVYFTLLQPITIGMRGFQIAQKGTSISGKIVEYRKPIGKTFKKARIKIQFTGIKLANGEWLKLTSYNSVFLMKATNKWDHAYFLPSQTYYIYIYPYLEADFVATLDEMKNLAIQANLQRIGR